MLDEEKALDEKARDDQVELRAEQSQGAWKTQSWGE